MKLGASLRRSRGGGGGRGRRKPAGSSPATAAPGDGTSARERLDLALRMSALALVGWGIGYLVATRVLYPAPPPPADLVQVPDLRGGSAAAGAERLAAVGLVLGPADSLRHPSIPRDLVLGQAPLAGQLALPGTEVRVTRSLGPETRPVPDVRNVDASRALVVLETGGFEVLVDSVDSDVPRGRVVSTRPAANTVVAVPARVVLSVSKGPPLVPMPQLLGMDELRAMALLDSLGLVLGVVEEVVRPAWEMGTVVDQAPPADTPLERGSAVRLAVGRQGA